MGSLICLKIRGTFGGRQPARYATFGQTPREYRVSTVQYFASKTFVKVTTETACHNLRRGRDSVKALQLFADPTSTATLFVFCDHRETQ